MRTRFLCAIVLLAPVIVSESFAQASDSLSFQGRLTDDSGVPINDPSVQITFKLYKNGTAVWTETHPSVVVDNGLFDVILGGTTPLDTVKFDVPIEIGITVEGDPEISPRTPLTSAAYAKALPGFYTFSKSLGLIESFNVIGGSPINQVGSLAIGATISGGGGMGSTDPEPNVVEGSFPTIGGGRGNTAYSFATVGGGRNNKAFSADASVAGGTGNVASASAASVAGGQQNKAKGSYSMIPGGVGNEARGYGSFAGGYYARARHDGSFVWSSSETTDSLLSTAAGQFLIDAPGGVGIGTTFIRSGSLVDIDGAIHFRSNPMFSNHVSATGTPDEDGVRFRYAVDYGGSLVDYLVIEKTDGNSVFPDGGIVFVNTGNDGIVDEALRIFGDGTVSIPGTLTNGIVVSKMDHPLDPQNRALYHSVVESPEMKNVYDGVVTLDASGEAVVRLPDYFEALNRDFRYQLTCIGGYAPVYVARKIDGNSFQVAGGRPGMEVSWQVTGTRRDPYAEMNRMEVEVDKAPNERGTYLHPQAYLSH